MTQRAVVFLCIALSLAPVVFISPCRASESAPVLLRGRIIARLYTVNAGLTPTQRAELAMKRLAELSRVPLAPSEIRVAPAGKRVGVYVRDQLLLVATPEEAAIRGITPVALADRWAGLLRTVLAEARAGQKTATDQRPATRERRLFLSATRLALPPGESRAVTVTATGGTPVVETAGGEASAILEASLTPVDRPGRWLLRVRGLAPGRAAVRLRLEGREATPPRALAAEGVTPPARGPVAASGPSAGARAPIGERLLSVQVMPYAARVLGPVEVAVTGRPAPAEWVRRCALERRDEALLTEPGAQLRWGKPLGVEEDLPPGESRIVTWPVRVTAPDRLPLETRVPVVVRNRDLPSRDAAVLLYSNFPERVTACGPLFLGHLDANTPARLLYHHQNGSGAPFYFRIELTNPGQAPAEVQVIEGAAGPTYNTVLVGHLAALRFARSWLGGVGRVHAIPAGRSRALLLRRVPNGDTVSGLLDLRPVGGGTLGVRVVAEEREEPVERGVPPAEAETPSEHVYPQPRKVLQARYRVGDPWTFIAIGQRAISARDGNRRLDGNYGVFYDILLTMENPTDHQRTIQVLLSPDAGFARGVFWIDGQLVEAPELAARGGVLASFQLGPGETRDVPIRTFPVAGSAYPARLVVRPTPLPRAPAPKEAPSDADPSA